MSNMEVELINQETFTAITPIPAAAEPATKAPQVSIYNIEMNA